MGIYIVKYLHSEWIKIGHFKTTDVKPSVYYRYIDTSIVDFILVFTLHRHFIPPTFFIYPDYISILLYIFSFIEKFTNYSIRSTTTPYLLSLSPQPHLPYPYIATSFIYIYIIFIILHYINTHFIYHSHPSNSSKLPPLYKRIYQIYHLHIFTFYMHPTSHLSTTRTFTSILTL